MSKHEKYDDSQLQAEPEGQSSPEGNEGLDDLEGAEDLLKTGLTVGKEVRIGLAVIVVLVIVLGAVVVKRMRHRAEPPAKAVVESKTADADKSGTSVAKDTAFRFDGPGFGSASRSGKPTVVAALSGPSHEAKPKSPHSEPDTWAFASDTKPKEGRSLHLPSFMPKVTEAAAPDRSAGLTDLKPPARSPGGWENDRNPARSAETPPAADPFRGRSLAADGHRGPELAGPAIPSAASSLNGKTADRGARVALPLVPSSDSRAPLAPSAANPLRGREDVALSRSSELGPGAPSPAKAGIAPAPRDTRDEFAPRFGEASTAESPKGPAAAGKSDLSASRFLRPSLSAAPSGSPGGLAMRSDSGPRPGDDSARRPDGTYVVLPNDNYWTISQRLFGTGAYFQALAQHNRSKYPRDDKLQAGDVISAPTAAELEKLYPQLCPTPTHRDAIDTRARTAGAATRGGAGKVYIVQEGDTLYDIARYELGKASRWGEIYELNRDALGKQFDYLSPGMQLVLPEGGPTISQRNESSPRR